MALSYRLNIFTGTFDLIDGTGTGDVVGPSSSTDNAIVRFDGTTGKLIQNYTSGAPTISDTGAITATQGGSLTGTWSDLGSVTTIDINGGTIDGLTDHITWGTGAAGVAGDWSVGRNAGTVFEFRVPTGNTWAFINQASTIMTISNIGDIVLASGGVTLSNNSRLIANVGFYFGAAVDTANPALWKLDTQTNPPFAIGVGTTAMYMMLLSNANVGGNYAHANMTNPTLSIYSATAAGSATLEFLDISHNTTNALYHAGKGGHAYTQNAVAGGAGLILFTPAAHTAMTAEKIDVTLAAHTVTLTDGTTIAATSSVSLGATTFNGVAAGGTETVTLASTLTIAAPIQGTNLTLTEGRTVNAAADTDATSVFGRVALTAALASDWATFSHFDQRASTSGYALSQNPSGQTILNSASGQTTLLRINNATIATIATGSIAMSARFVEIQGADVASTTNLVLGTDGNTFEITGTTKVDLISNAGWVEGAKITLIANESLVIDHGTATSGANVQIRLEGAVDYSMTAGDTLTLCLSSTTAEGQAWREISRAVI